MKIAFIGTQSVGKTTLIQNVLKRWSIFKTPQLTYRDIIDKQKLKLNKKGCEKDQKIILNALVDEVQSASVSEDTHILFDRSVIDNIAYSLWLHEHKRVSENFVSDSKTIAAEALKMYDILFYLPLHDDIPIVKKQNRNIDPVYRQEIDNIFQAMISTYERGRGIFFPKSDCPAVITLDAHPSARCDQIKLYLNEEGNFYGEDTPSLITPYYS
jgi:predicted ATPase